MTRRLARGGLAGLVATLPMTLVILAARSLGLFRTPPPAENTRNAVAAVGDAASASAATSGATSGATGGITRGAASGAGSGATGRLTWLATHAGVGAAFGVGYTVARPLLPSSRLAAGLVYGGAAWALAYLGVVPALGLYPWPDEDRPARRTVMVVAHAVFGVALAEADHRLAGAVGTRRAR